MVSCTLSIFYFLDSTLELYNEESVLLVLVSVSVSVFLLLETTFVQSENDAVAKQILSESLGQKQKVLCMLKTHHLTLQYQSISTTTFK